MRHARGLLYKAEGHARVEETESSLVPGTPVGFHSHTYVFLSSSPMAMSHGCGDLSHPVFWGNHVLLQHGRIARSCLFPCLATALGTSVCLAVCAEKLYNPKILLIDSKIEGLVFCMHTSSA
ncbi:hypothetical protein GOBAR_AA17889 [Gossypium barbadense]|uniref:Uncharacterized protein n=1 Tax=Gossypium barbadense TaxID=3634 RepID=A0A2P5XHK4_GOSBA|nr:hypothetical protein GOBAR_AA17889 [Gossypium barbadense]